MFILGIVLLIGINYVSNSQQISAASYHIWHRGEQYADNEIDVGTKFYVLCVEYSVTI